MLFFSPQIGDFGLARDLVNETSYTPTSKGAKIPVKWMAPEVYSRYSFAAVAELWKSDNKEIHSS